MTDRAQSTAYTAMFKAYLSSDHVTEATGKTIAITISKNGGAFGNPNAGATNATEVSNGWYKVALDATDTNTLGPLAIRGAVATIDDVGILEEVVSATAGRTTNLDATISSRLAPTVAARTLDVSAGGEAGIDWANVGSPTTAVSLTNTTVATVTTVTTTTNLTNLPSIPANWLTAAGINAAAFTAAKFAAGAIDANALAADAVDEIWDEVMEGTTTARQSLRLANSANGAKADGMATTTAHLRDLADSKNRVTATVDASGNRTAVTLDLT